MPQEFQLYAMSAGYDPEEVEVLFLSTDTDGDGVLSFKEFVQMLKTAYI